MTILAIETSCDETAIAISKNGEILVSLIASQIDTHKAFGGVVPEVSARMHIEAIIPLIKQALLKTKLTKTDIDAIAVTQGPGLLPSLVIGVDTAKSLAYAWNKPLIAINHMEGHVYSALLELENTQDIFPLLMLLVSGGHTEIILMKDHGSYEKLGKTRDDAVGEAFDKVAKMLGLPYPGGPEIAQCAQTGDAEKYTFAKPLIDKPGFEFSFSGLKTDVFRKIQKIKNPSNQDKADIAASFQKTAIDILLEKFMRAAKKHTPKTIAIAGGVSANKLLRKQFTSTFSEAFPESTIIIPNMHYCTDNAAMIARAAEEKYKRKEFADNTLTAESRLSL
jgi:N6-L-threonylcarbamoyladenine synthase